MKNLLIIFGVFTFLNCFSQDYIELDIKQINLKGNIKKITETRYSNLEYYRNKGSEIDPTIHTFEFNNFGNITEVNHYSSNKVLFKKKVCIYDNNQNLIELKQDFPNKTLRAIATYKYDGQSKLIQKNINSVTIFYKYDISNNLIEEKSFYEDGSLKTKMSYIYDQHNFKRFTYVYFYENELASKIEHHYDDADREIEAIHFFPDKKTIKLKRYTKYDSFGNIIEHNPYGQDYITAKYIYTYDANNNWVKRIELKSDKEEEIIERIIEYK